jgi:hypothetical protein
MTDPEAVPAAPNQSAITAEVLSVHPSPTFSDKWELDLKLIESRTVSGPNFGRPGERVRAFAFGTTPHLVPGMTINADAEFVGDEHGGTFRLTRLSPTPE